jgi:DNA polymerase-3 subunit beta
MQLVSTSRDTLLKPLQVVSGIVERRHTLPILANLLLRKQKDKIAFVSTDIEIQITTYADFGVGDDDASTTFGASFTLQTLAANEFPTMQESSDNASSFSVPQKLFKQLISQVYFAMAQQDIRYYLNGMLFVLEGKNLIAVATDGHRLAFGQIILEQAVAGNTERLEVIVPRKTILECQHLLDDSDEPLNIQLTSNQVKFTFGSIELLSKLVEGKFPDYQRVIPKGHKNSLVVKRDILQAALQRAAILTTDKFKGIRCSLKNNCLTVQSTNAEQEEAQEDIETSYSGDEIDIGFNVSYLLDVLANLKAEEVQISLGDSNSSALITLPSDDNFKYVVMPMRI